MDYHDMNQKEQTSFVCRSFILAALFFVQAMLIPCDAGATLATEEEMTQVCENWLAQTVFEKGSWAQSESPSIASAGEITSDDGRVLARYYSIHPTGFVVVPALKEMQPIKAYSDESILDDRQSGGFLQLLKDILSERMTLYENRWGSLDSPQSGTNDGIFGKGQVQLWDRFTQDSDTFESKLSAAKNRYDEVGPLLTSSWDQRAPYNNYCPADNGGDCIAGCTAIAMAQILNYWQWPANGFGSYEYYWSADCCPEGGTPQYLSADFSDEYDWANIPDSCDLGCTQAEEDAVAELCYEAGVSIDMNYGSCGSGAFPSPYAYHHHFKYAEDIIVESRPDYDLDGWFSLIKNEIDSGRPIQYGISGHQIVCDGYQDNGEGVYAYHMNYGWAGAFTTWFVFDSLYCFWEPDSLCPATADRMWTNIKPQTDPIITIAGYSISSDEDGDGHADVDENVDLNVVVSNDGWDVSNLVGSLTTDDPYVTILTSSSMFDALIPWASQSQSTSPYSVVIDAGCPDPHVATLTIDFTGDGGYAVSDTLVLFIGDTKGFSDDCESGIGGWSSTSISFGYGDEWHLETYRSHSGNQSWKMGGLGSANYGNLMDAGLMSPPFLLPEYSTLTFWHWIDAESDIGTTAWDGAVVMISNTDGDWSIIEPVGGYDYTIIDESGLPLDAGTGCYSGLYDWREAVFDLSPYTGVVRLIFRFMSDPLVNEEGWYIDDVNVDSSSAVVTWDTLHTACTGLAIASNSQIWRPDPSPSTGGVSMDYYGNGDCEENSRWYLSCGSPVIAYKNLQTAITHTDNVNSEADDFIILPDIGDPYSTETTADYQVLQSGTILSSDSVFAFELTTWAPSNPDDCHFMIQRKKVFKYRDVPVDSIRIGDAINWQIPSSASANIGGVDADYNLVYQQGQNEITDPGCMDNEKRFGGITLLGYYYNNDLTIRTSAHGAFVERRSVYVWPTHQYVPAELMPLMSQPGFQTTSSQEDLFSVMTYVADPVLELGDTLYVYSAMITLLDGTIDSLRNQVMRARDWAGNYLGLDLSCCVGESLGNLDGDPALPIDMGDLTLLIDMLFLSLQPVACLVEADLDLSGQPSPVALDVDMGDLTLMIDHLFLTLTPLPLCP